MEIIIIEDKTKRREIKKNILENLTDWFEVEESRNNYINNCDENIFVAASDNEKVVGFLSLKETSKDTIEMEVMGVLKDNHRNGIGKRLFEKGLEEAKKLGYSFIQVKTVKMGMYEEYDQTNRFYQALGFKELEVFPLYWDELNPCQIYIMSI